jgi:hypothetical protein
MIIGTNTRIPPQRETISSQEREILESFKLETLLALILTLLRIVVSQDKKIGVIKTNIYRGRIKKKRHNQSFVTKHRFHHQHWVRWAKKRLRVETWVINSVGRSSGVRKCRSVG